MKKNILEQFEQYSCDLLTTEIGVDKQTIVINEEGQFKINIPINSKTARTVGTSGLVDLIAYRSLDRLIIKAKKKLEFYTLLNINLNNMIKELNRISKKAIYGNWTNEQILELKKAIKLWQTEDENSKYISKKILNNIYDRLEKETLINNECKKCELSDILLNFKHQYEGRDSIKNNLDLISEIIKQLLSEDNKFDIIKADTGIDNKVDKIFTYSKGARWFIPIDGSYKYKIYKKIKNNTETYIGQFENNKLPKYLSRQEERKLTQQSENIFCNIRNYLSDDISQILPNLNYPNGTIIASLILDRGISATIENIKYKTHFVSVTSSSSQARTGQRLFCTENIYNYIDYFNTLGQNVSNTYLKNNKHITSKICSMLGLNLSTSFPCKNIRVSNYNIILVKDTEFDVKCKCEYIETNNPKNIIYKKDILDSYKILAKNKVHINGTDGMYIITKEMLYDLLTAAKFSKKEIDITLNQYSYYQSRVANQIKGMCLAFDWRSLLKEFNIHTITDKYNRVYNIDDIDMIVPESCWKGSRLFPEIKDKNGNIIADQNGDYAFDRCMKQLDYIYQQFNQPQFRICSIEHSKKSYCELTYQYLNTNLGYDEDLLCNMCKEVLNIYYTALGCKYNKVTNKLEFNNKITKQDRIMAIKLIFNMTIDNEEYILNNIYKKSLLAIQMNDNMIYNRYIVKQLTSLIIDKVKNLAQGKIPVSGNYIHILSDPLALLTKGKYRLLDSGQYYLTNCESKYAILYRSPHNNEHETCIIEFTNSDLLSKYLGNINDAIFFNVKSIEPLRLGGADFDGDKIFLHFLDFYTTSPTSKYMLQIAFNYLVQCSYHNKKYFKYDKKFSIENLKFMLNEYCNKRKEESIDMQLPVIDNYIKSDIPLLPWCKESIIYYTILTTCNQTGFLTNLVSVANNMLYGYWRECIKYEELIENNKSENNILNKERYKYYKQLYNETLNDIIIGTIAIGNEIDYVKTFTHLQLPKRIIKTYSSKYNRPMWLFNKYQEIWQNNYSKDTKSYKREYYWNLLINSPMAILNYFITGEQAGIKQPFTNNYLYDSTDKDIKKSWYSYFEKLQEYNEKSKLEDSNINFGILGQINNIAQYLYNQQYQEYETLLLSFIRDIDKINKIIPYIKNIKRYYLSEILKIIKLEEDFKALSDTLSDENKKIILEHKRNLYKYIEKAGMDIVIKQLDGDINSMKILADAVLLTQSNDNFAWSIAFKGILANIASHPSSVKSYKLINLNINLDINKKEICIKDNSVLGIMQNNKLYNFDNIFTLNVPDGLYKVHRFLGNNYIIAKLYNKYPQQINNNSKFKDIKELNISSIDKNGLRFLVPENKTLDECIRAIKNNNQFVTVKIDDLISTNKNGITLYGKFPNIYIENDIIGYYARDNKPNINLTDSRFNNKQMEVIFADNLVDEKNLKDSKTQMFIIYLKCKNFI